MKRITIIGGGASGTLVAANLLRDAGDRPLEVNLVERRPAVGRGVAYSTDDDVHVLNVPAGRMGAFPDDVGHFHRWLAGQGLEFGVDDFVPRRLFGEYLRSVLDAARNDKPKPVRFNLFEDDAADIILQEGKAQVTFGSGDHIYSEMVVLAFGNFLPPHPSVSDLSFVTHPKYFRDPWAKGVFPSIGKEDEVLIVGTGLSMVDVVLKLTGDGHEGKINALSTRGLLPAVHQLGYSYPDFSKELIGMTRITDMFKVVRQHISKAGSDSNWRAVIDSLRPATQRLWRSLPVSEKRYFMQHLSRYWNVARHRMAPQAAATIDRLQIDGKLTILKGRLREIKANGRFAVAFSTDGHRREVSADTIINCIGSESNFQKLDSRLVSALFARGYIRNDALNFGIDALPNGSILGQNGEVTGILYTLGTALKGTLWETTAIPEIRAQAKQLAATLLSA